MWEKLGNQFSDAFKGLGNLIARTGILQGTMRALSVAVGVLNWMLPDTVAELEGLQNVMPDLSRSADAAAASLTGLGNAAPGDLGGDAARDAAGGIDALSKAMDELRDRMDALGDAQLQQDLAKIDLAAARAPQTAGNRARFDEQRRQARRGAEGRRLEREALAADLGLDEASGRTATAQASLQQVQERNAREVGGLEDRRGQLSAASGGILERFGGRSGAALAVLESQLQEAVAGRDLAAQGGVGNADATRAATERVRAIEGQIEALQELVRVEVQLRTERDRARREENAATANFTSAINAQSTAATRVQIANTNLQTYGVTGQAGDIAAGAASTAATGQDITAGARAGADVAGGVVNARGANVGPNVRNQAAALQRGFQEVASAAANYGEMTTAGQRALIQGYRQLLQEQEQLRRELAELQVRHQRRR